MPHADPAPASRPRVLRLALLAALCAAAWGCSTAASSGGRESTDATVVDLGGADAGSDPDDGGADAPEDRGVDLAGDTWDAPLGEEIAPDVAPDVAPEDDTGDGGGDLAPDATPEVGDVAEDGSEPADIVEDLPPPIVPASIRIEPPFADVRTELGVTAVQHFDVLVTMTDGSVEPRVDGIVWSTSDPYRARPSGTGDVTLIADRDGSFEVRARLDELDATASVDVTATARRVLDGLDPSIATAFDSARPDTSGATPASWLYPEDGTMFPAGIVPPVLQWRPGSGVVHRVSIARGRFFAVAYTSGTRWAVPADIWRALDYAHGAPIILTLDSLTAVSGGASLYGGARTVFLADAALSGDVYYWQVATGDIMRIPESATTPTAVFSTNATSGNCRGCHTITRDGGRLGYMYNGGDNPRAGLAWANAPEPPIIANGSAFRWDMLSFNPSGRRAVAVLFGTAWLADTTPDLPGGVGSLGDIAVMNAGGTVTHPAWSPDGSTVTFVRRDANADWNFYGGDLYHMSWDPRSETFGAPRLFVGRGGTAETDTLSYPTWTPDSRYVAYVQGPDNRGTTPSTLWLADARSGAHVQLAHAGPGGDDVYTSFSPYLEGGYYWLLFYSRRPYGNTTTEKQLWVAAIDADAGLGADPSYAAFWLPGQDPGHDNITGAWSPPPCPSLGGDCKDTGDCCAGYECLEDGDGNFTCQTSTCSLPGAPCAAGDRCCPGHECAPDLNGVSVCQPAFE